ncbi:CPSF A subunit region-domain-containing protein [Halteromyces radiatus]|uniref:CPSF A subunit region-domain-containing protein n=1 Tax=Halteromyces radiatus TaxID=101107 RepID=UPI00221F979F|nr:CPSF A subunit region-domain-containing protein [Halteromyces radiatus]KAI8100016.1 CPSF A subunit region-domain-containing protein [Halteromyces radiatus]
MSIYTYINTLQPPTAVHQAIKGNFISPNNTNLIVSKGTRIEIYSFSNDILVPVLDFNLHCRIASIKAVTLPNQTTCSLFVLSEQQVFCILRYSPASKSIITDFTSTLEQKNARPNDEVLCVLDPENRAIVVSAFTGLLFVIPLQSRNAPIRTIKGKGKETAYPGMTFDPFDIRIQEFSIKSMVALEEPTTPTFAILYDQDDGPHVKFYQIKAPNRQISPRYQVDGPVESSCHLLIPVPQPYGGVLVVGEYTITYFDMDGNDAAISIDAVIITMYEYIGGPTLRCILGDTTGTLYMLSIITTGTMVTDLSIRYLGEAAVCSSIVYLGFNILYFGSSQGDSSLARLCTNGKITTLELIDEYSNLAPITDFCLYDLDKQGRQTMVCCSGANNDGSLRVVQSGVGFIERAVIPVSGVQRIWSLSSDAISDNSFHDLLVLSFIGNTRLLYQADSGEGMSMEELDSFSAFDLENQTLVAGNLSNGNIIQITTNEIRVMSPSINNKMVKLWFPPPSVKITNGAVGYDDCIVVSCTFGQLVSFKINPDDGNIIEANNIKLEHEISCLTMLKSKNMDHSYVAVGLWGGQNVQILNLSSFSVVGYDTVEQSVPRSILFQTLQDESYIFVTLGDGRLIVYPLSNSMELLQPNVITLGTQTATLSSFSIHDDIVVFAASDRPTVINSVRNHLVYSAINLKNVIGFTMFNSASWRNSLLVITDQALLLGDLDPIRKLHYSKLPLGKKMGRRIAYHEESQTLVVGTSRLTWSPDNGAELKTGWINVYDARTFQELEVHDLLEYELVESICVAKVFDETQSYVFVGTAITLPSEPQRSIGRLIMYQVLSDQTYHMVDAINVPGVVYCIKSYKNSIVAAVNGTLYYLDSFKPESVVGEKLNMSQKIHANVLALDLDTHGDLILVGDFMQSISLVKLNDQDTSAMTTIANDYNANWMTAVKMVADDVYIGAEMSHNLFTMKTPSQKSIGSNDGSGESIRMDVVGEYHLGDLINRMHHGTLADEMDTLTKTRDTWTIVYATVNGAIGTMMGISEEEYEYLLTVQERLLEISPPIGQLDYASWRAFNNGTRTGAARNYIDGDLIERFLLLSKKEQEQVVEPFPFSVEELQSEIEKFSQLR